MESGPEQVSVSPVPAAPIPNVAGQSFRVSDRPHNWTVWAAAGAIAVSATSCWHSCRSAHVAEQALALSQASSRAVVQAISAELPDYELPPIPARLVVTVTNFGRTRAVKVKLSATYLFFSEDLPQYPTRTPPPISLPFRQPGVSEEFDMAPGFSRPVPVNAGVWLAPEDSAARTTFYLGQTTYMDDVTGIHYQEFWCFLMKAHRRPYGGATPPPLERCQGPITFVTQKDVASPN